MNRGTFNEIVPPAIYTLKLTLTLTQTPTLTGGQFSLGDNCPDTGNNSVLVKIRDS